MDCIRELPTGRMRSKDNQRMFESSGCFETNDRLVAFLYVLMRDIATPGTIEGILDGPSVGSFSLTNGWLAQHAEDIAKRLRG